MENEKQQLEALQDIRKMMKQSSKFLSLRDQVFEDRFARIAGRRAVEMAFFESKPWARAAIR